METQSRNSRRKVTPQADGQGAIGVPGRTATHRAVVDEDWQRIGRHHWRRGQVQIEFCRFADGEEMWFVSRGGRTVAVCVDAEAARGKA